MQIKKARIKLRILLGSMTALTCAELVYMVASVITEALEDVLMLVLAPIYYLLFAIPVLLSEWELFRFLRHIGDDRTASDVLAALLSVILLLLFISWSVETVFIGSAYLWDLYHTSAVVYWLICIVLKIFSSLYASYDRENGSGHMVVITGVDPINGMVYFNNPWYKSGRLTYDKFWNGFVGSSIESKWKLSNIYCADCKKG